MAKRAILYARVSTDEQADKGYSLPSQLDAMRKYAAQQGFEVVAEFCDDYSGATPIEFRPEGGKAYTMLKSSQADVIIAYTIDRFVRPPEDGDEWDMPIFIRGLAKSGREIHTCDRGQLKTDFASLLIAMLGAKGAGEERRKIIERTTRGRRWKAEAGKVVGHGWSPYGYRFEYVAVKPNARPVVVGLVIVESEARIVRLIFTWYVRGDGERPPMALRAIARELSMMKVPTPGELRQGIKRKRANYMWDAATVRLILKNETYAGLWHYRKVNRQNNHSERRDLQEQILVQVSPIVDRDLWDAAQARLQYNQKMSLRNCQHPYLLRGMIRCACGAAMQAQNVVSKDGKYRYAYYICTANPHKHVQLEKPCREPAARCEAVEEKVWEYVYNVFSNRDKFEADLRRAQQSELDSLTPKQERLKIVNELMADRLKEADDLRAKVKQLGGGLVGQGLEKDVQEVERHYAELSKEHDELQAEIAARELTEEAVNSLEQFREDMVAGLDNPTFEDKRRALELLRAEVTVKQRQATVRLKRFSVRTTNS